MRWPGFSLGRIVVDRVTSKKLQSEDIIPALSRHTLGDFGLVTEQRESINRTALFEGKAIRSKYCSDRGLRFSVITSGDRTMTIVKVL